MVIFSIAVVQKNGTTCVYIPSAKASNNEGDGCYVEIANFTITLKSMSANRHGMEYISNMEYDINTLIKPFDCFSGSHSKVYIFLCVVNSEDSETFRVPVSMDDLDSVGKLISVLKKWKSGKNARMDEELIRGKAKLKNYFIGKYS